MFALTGVFLKLKKNCPKKSNQIVGVSINSSSEKWCKAFWGCRRWCASSDSGEASGVASSTTPTEVKVRTETVDDGSRRTVMTFYRSTMFYRSTLLFQPKTFRIRLCRRRGWSWSRWNSWCWRWSGSRWERNRNPEGDKKNQN